ncbi:MAG: AMP-binding protein [Betaproteobacteria bacterium]|nr:MAG: AMP-binding protein [Betaproteobacteria bacterium]
MDASKYGTLYQSLQRTAEKFGDRPAYVVPPLAGRTYHPDGWQVSWAETLAAVEEKKRIYAQAGYGLGHRVAILFEQRPEFFFHYYALNSLGVGIVPINPDYRVDEIRYVVEHSEASLALCVDHRLNEMNVVAEQIGNGLPVVSFDNFPAVLPSPKTPAQSGTPGPETEAALLYTSGTTGRPKGCILTNEYFHTFGACYLSLGGRLDFREGRERLYNPLPLHHANCLSISVPAMLLNGGCLIFPDRFHASTWWQDLVATRATAVQFQGIIPNILLKLPVCAQEREHQVRFALCAGVEPSQHEVFEKRFGFPVVEMWAMTETGRLISDNHEPRSIHTRAFGRPNPWIEARAVDESDRDVPANVPGQLIIRHSEATPRKGFFSGYLKNEQATEEAWRNGWFHTGDAVVRDESGMFYFVDRKKNIIRRSGENIAAAEIEACITSHDKVKQVAVIAAPDEVREEEVMACVIAKSPDDVTDATEREALAGELFDWCYERMAYFKAPGWILFVDSLPMGTSAKVQKIHIFPAGTDPRQQPGAIDLRKRKKQKQTATH